MWTSTSRQAATLFISRLSTSFKSSPPPYLVHRRGLATATGGGGGDHHVPPKVNFWEDPLSPSKWKKEHFVIVSLTGCGLLFYGGYMYLTGGKNDKKEKKVGEAPR